MALEPVLSRGSAAAVACARRQAPRACARARPRSARISRPAYIIVVGERKSKCLSLSVLSSHDASERDAGDKERDEGRLLSPSHSSFFSTFVQNVTARARVGSSRGGALREEEEEENAFCDPKRTY